MTGDISEQYKFCKMFCFHNFKLIEQLFSVIYKSATNFNNGFSFVTEMTGTCLRNLYTNTISNMLF